MPLTFIGFIDGIRQIIIYTISLLGTSSVPEEADAQTTGGTATAGWRFNTSGTTDRLQNTYTLGYDDWATPVSGSPGAQYEIRATRRSGTETSLTTGNLNTWELMTSNILYSLSTNAQDGVEITISLKIEIRDALTQTIQDTGYYDISALSSDGGGGPGTPGEATP